MIHLHTSLTDVAELRSAFGVRLRNPERVELPLSSISW
jgi:hypothetical protein